jgi:predicted transcriptional regulator
MKLKKLVDQLNLVTKVGGQGLEEEVEGGYVSDLLSDVMANSQKGDLWITLQVHVNIVAVAVLKELAGIIIIGGREPEGETLQKAKDENVVILTSSFSAFEVAGRLFQLGLRGKKQ